MITQKLGYSTAMDLLRSLAATMVAAILSWFFAVIKSGHDTDIKLAVISQKVDDLAGDLKAHREMTGMALAQITNELKSALSELHAAASNIRALSETQAIINKMSATTLDKLVDKLEDMTKDVIENKAIIENVVRQIKLATG